jgi:hypothetical protein
MEPTPQRNSRTIATALLATAFGVLALSFVLGMIADPAFFAIAAAALVAFVLSAAYATGRLGEREPAATRDPDPVDTRYLAAEATDDPSYHRYR